MEPDWEDQARTIIRVELVRARVNYKELAWRFEQMGIQETAANLSNKVARGRFSFAFFLQCMKAIGVTVVDIDGAVNGATLKGAEDATNCNE